MKWLGADNQFLLWENPIMKFSAYYPVSEGTSMNSFVLPTNQSSLIALKQAEYLVSEEKEYSKESPVLIKFNRKIARVVVNIRFSNNIGKDTVISSVRITSPASNFSNSAITQEPVSIHAYQSTNNRFYAMVLPTGEISLEEPFIHVTTTNDNVYTLKSIPSMEEGFIPIILLQKMGLLSWK